MTRAQGAAPPGSASTTLEEAEATVSVGAPHTPVAPAVHLDELLADLASPAAAPEPEAAPRKAPLADGMRTARVVRVSGRDATIALRGRADPIEATVAPEVDPCVVADAHADGESVLVELCEGEPPLIVAALHTKRPREIRLKAAVVHIEGDEEVLLRSGRGAIRVRSDGDIEVVGSRISAASRGLFRIVGRLLRLN